MANVDETPSSLDIQLIRTAALPLQLTLTKKAADGGGAYPVNGQRVRLYIKTAHTDANTVALKTYDTNGGGITVLNDSGGLLQINRLDTDFSSKDPATGYPNGKYRVYVVWLDGIEEPVLKGNWIIKDI